MNRTLAFSKRNFKELIRDPIALIFEIVEIPVQKYVKACATATNPSKYQVSSVVLPHFGITERKFILYIYYNIY